MIDEHFSAVSILAGAALFSGMLAAVEIGARRRGRAKERKEGHGSGIIESGVFAMLGLLIALTFTGAAERINDRAKLTIDESDALGTAFLRLDVLSEPEREPTRRLLRDYTAARIEEYAHIRARAEHLASRERTAALRDRLWSLAVAAAGRSRYPHAPQLTLPILNDAFDIAGRREAVRRIHPPAAVYLLLVMIGLLASLLAGYGLADADDRRWLHRLAFCSATAVAFFITLNMEAPRHGFIRMGRRDLVLAETLAEMDRLLATRPGPGAGSPHRGPQP